MKNLTIVGITISLVMFLGCTAGITESQIKDMVHGEGVGLACHLTGEVWCERVVVRM